MKIKIYTIDVTFPRWLKSTLFLLVVATGVVLGVGAAVHADSISQLKQFTPNQMLLADDLNENFRQLRDAVNAPVVVSARQITAGTLPAGVTISADQVTAGSLPTGVTLAGSQVSSAVANANTCTSCSSATGALETRLATVEGKATGGNFAEISTTLYGVPTTPLLRAPLHAPTSGYIMAIASTRVCAFAGDYWLALSSLANDVPLTGRSGPYGFARANSSEKYCESVTVSRTFQVSASLTTIYLNVQTVAENGAEFVAPTLNLIFYKDRLE